MDFNKLYVDNLFLRSLQKTAIQEGWLHDTGENLLWRNHLKSRTLLYLTLFEEIDSPSMLLYEEDCTKFVETGLFRRDAHLLDDSRSQFENELALGPSSNYYCSIQEIRKTAREMLARNRLKVIDQVYVKVAGESDDTVSIKDILDNYKHVMDAKDEEIERTNPDLLDLKDTLENTRDTLEKLLFMSTCEQVPFVTDLIQPWNPSPHPELELVETAMYVVRTKLKDELIYLPDPRNLDDVLRMRSDLNLRRLRSVLQEWAAYLQGGEDVLEVRARKDIRKANKELRRLARWREYKNSPLNFWLNSIGGHIPYLSNILTVVLTLGGLYESYSEHRNGWIMIGKS